MAHKGFFKQSHEQKRLQVIIPTVDCYTRIVEDLNIKTLVISECLCKCVSVDRFSGVNNHIEKLDVRNVSNELKKERTEQIEEYKEAPQELYSNFEEFCETLMDYEHEEHLWIFTSMIYKQTSCGVGFCRQCYLKNKPFVFFYSTPYLFVSCGYGKTLYYEISDR